MGFAEVARHHCADGFCFLLGCWKGYVETQNAKKCQSRKPDLV